MNSFDNHLFLLFAGPKSKAKKTCPRLRNEIFLTLPDTENVSDLYELPPFLTVSGALQKHFIANAKFIAAIELIRKKSNNLSVQFSHNINSINLVV